MREGNGYHRDRKNISSLLAQNYSKMMKKRAASQNSNKMNKYPQFCTKKKHLNFDFLPSEVLTTKWTLLIELNLRYRINTTPRRREMIKHNKKLTKILTVWAITLWYSLAIMQLLSAFSSSNALQPLITLLIMFSSISQTFFCFEDSRFFRKLCRKWYK